MKAGNIVIIAPGLSDDKVTFLQDVAEMVKGAEYAAVSCKIGDDTHVRALNANYMEKRALAQGIADIATLEMIGANYGVVLDALEQNEEEDEDEED